MKFLGLLLSFWDTLRFLLLPSSGGEWTWLWCLNQAMLICLLPMKSGKKNACFYGSWRIKMKRCFKNGHLVYHIYFTLEQFKFCKTSKFKAHYVQGTAGIGVFYALLPSRLGYQLLLSFISSMEKARKLGWSDMTLNHVRSNVGRHFRLSTMDGKLVDKGKAMLALWIASALQWRYRNN